LVLAGEAPEALIEAAALPDPNDHPDSEHPDEEGEGSDEDPG
jgi:hypothetical protein